MGINSKTPKGEISIENYRGNIRLRWRYQGKRYPLSLPYNYAPENMHHATVKAAEIKLDIMKGCFDPTLEKYKPVKPEVESEPILEIVPIHPQFICKHSTRGIFLMYLTVATFATTIQWII